MAKKPKVETKVIGKATGTVVEVNRKKGVGYIKTPRNGTITFYLNNLPKNVKARVGLKLKFTMKQQGKRIPIARRIRKA